MGKKITNPQGKVMDMGIYGDLSTAGLKTLQQMMNITSPGKKKKKEVRKPKEK